MLSKNVKMWFLGGAGRLLIYVQCKKNWWADTTLIDLDSEKVLFTLTYWIRLVKKCLCQSGRPPFTSLSVSLHHSRRTNSSCLSSSSRIHPWVSNLLPPSLSLSPSTPPPLSFSHHALSHHNCQGQSPWWLIASSAEVKTKDQKPTGLFIQTEKRETEWVSGKRGRSEWK